MKTTTFALAIATLIAIPAASAQAALNAYLKIKSSNARAAAPIAVKIEESELKQLMAEGQNSRAARTAIVSPRDAASGLPTGKRQHKPFSITKVYDKSTPKLYMGYRSKQALPQMEIDVVRTNDAGKEEVYLTIKLENCLITSYQTSASQGGDRPMESLSFNYSKIEFDYKKER